MKKRRTKNIYLSVVDAGLADKFRKFCKKALLDVNAVVAKLISDFLKKKGV